MIRRRASGPAAEGLCREGEILARARHPGVVELVAITSDGETAELVTAAAPGRALLELALTVEEVAGVVAAVATTVADLHDIGIAHGALAGDRVTVGEDGRVILDGFGAAVGLDGPPSRWPDHPAARADDRALGELLDALLERCAPSQVMRPLEGARRRLPVGSRRQVEGPATRMRTWAAWAAHGDIPCRRLADALATGIPGACLPAPRASHRDPTGDVNAGTEPLVPRECMPDNALERWFTTDTPGERARTITATAPPHPRGSGARKWAVRAAMMTVGLTWGLVTLFDRPAARATPTGSAGCVAGTVRRGGPAAPPCATYDDGVLTIGAARFLVGRRGDVAAIGRWGCGAARLALLRPATGDVWTFASWPADDAPVAARLAASVAGARGLEVLGRRRCDVLVALGRDGVHRVHVPA